MWVECDRGHDNPCDVLWANSVSGPLLGQPSLKTTGQQDLRCPGVGRDGYVLDSNPNL